MQGNISKIPIFSSHINCRKSNFDLKKQNCWCKYEDYEEKLRPYHKTEVLLRDQFLTPMKAYEWKYLKRV